MSNLQPGWRRKPLPDCPLCGGRGKIEFHLYSQVKTKFRDPQDEERAASWMAYAATSEGACSCVRWSRTHDFYQRLRQVRKHMDRVKKSKMMMKQPWEPALGSNHWQARAPGAKVAPQVPPTARKCHPTPFGAVNLNKCPFGAAR